MPDDERCLLLLSGHALNQILTLLKLVTISANNHPENSIEETICAAQSHTILRLMVGMLAESLVWLNRPANQQLIGHCYLATLSTSAQESYNTIKMHFGKSSLMQRIRNRFSFHFPSADDLNAAFACTPEDQDWSLYMSDALSNSVWLPSELVMGFGAIRSSGIEDPMKGFAEITDEAMLLTNAISGFLTDLMLKMMIRHFGHESLKPELALSVHNAPSSKEFFIPFYLDVSGNT